MDKGEQESEKTGFRICIGKKLKAQQCIDAAIPGFSYVGWRSGGDNHSVP